MRQKSFTPLHLAVDRGSYSIVSDILRKGADVNARDLLERTPLHRIIITKHLGIAKLLIRAGADVEARDATQRTVLNYAAAENSASLVRLLIDHGAKGPNPLVDTGVLAQTAQAGKTLVLQTTE